MIDYEGNDHRPEAQQQPEPKTDKQSLEWLEANAGFRPIGAEW